MVRSVAVVMMLAAVIGCEGVTNDSGSTTSRRDRQDRSEERDNVRVAQRDQEPTDDTVYGTDEPVANEYPVVDDDTVATDADQPERRRRRDPNDRQRQRDPSQRPDRDPGDRERGPREFPPLEEIIPASLDYESSVAYGTDSEMQQLDICWPKNTTGRLPLIVMVHGGGFVGGDKGVYHRRITTYAQEGYVAATLNYRLAGEAPFPAQIADVKQAVRFLRANAEKYHIDPDRVGGVGHSAGGTLVTLLAVSDNSLGKTDKFASFSDRVQCAVATSGAHDFRADSGYVWRDANWESFEGLFGGPIDGSGSGSAKAFSSVTYVTSDDAPVFMAHGTDDIVVDPQNSKDLAAALQAAGVEHQLIIVEGGSHGNAGSRPEVRAASDVFLAKHLK